MRKELEKILAITMRNKRFNVSLRWRDVSLQKACNALVKEGKLQKVGRVRREIVYVLPETKWKMRSGYLIIENAPKPKDTKSNRPSILKEGNDA